VLQACSNGLSAAAAAPLCICQVPQGAASPTAQPIAGYMTLKLVLLYAVTNCVLHNPRCCSSCVVGIGADLFVHKHTSCLCAVLAWFALCEALNSCWYQSLTCRCLLQNTVGASGHD
jgi:hypothetical protein